MAHEVFISYSSKDTAAAEAVCSTLEGRGIRCWMAPRDILPSVPYGEALLDAIYNCRMLVLVFSENSNSSSQVRREVERAASKDIPILPLRIRNVIPSKGLAYFISSHHWLDAFTGPLEPYLDRLADTIQQLLGSKEPDMPAPAQTSETRESLVVLPPAWRAEKRRVKGSKEPDTPAPAQAAETRESLVALPPRWTAEKRRVKVATPEGDVENDIWFYTNSLGMRFVLVPAGEYESTVKVLRGGQPAQGVLRVRISRPFYLGACPVTVDEFRRFVEATGYKTEPEQGEGGSHWIDREWKSRTDITWRSPSFEQGGSHPVVCVTWHDARKFVEWLSHAEGLSYGLPTDAQWEHACRAGTRTTYYWGSDFRDDCAWATKNSKSRTHPVGLLLPNAWGLYDMSGNVWEWCQDWWDPKSVRSGVDPEGPPSGEKKVMRGASWWNAPDNCRSSNRFAQGPSSAGTLNGFRVMAAV